MLVMKGNVTKLIAFIVCYASERDINLSTVRLVKFLYLADLYCARYYKGETFTKFPWRFIHYGPYCAEALNAIDEAELAELVQSKTYASKFGLEDDYKVYYCQDMESHEFSKDVPDEIISLLKKAIRKYGEDTPALLDHVYFDTEPMEPATKGDLLDFTKAKSLIVGRENAPKKLSNDELNEGKKNIMALVEKYRDGKRQLQNDAKNTSAYRDTLYYETIQNLDGDDLPTGLDGVATIII